MKNGNLSSPFRMFMDVDKKAIELSRKRKGKITISSKLKKGEMDLSLVYTPGVAAVAMAIKKNEEDEKNLTYSGNSIAVITDGTRVLGLGNIGPHAAMPVMEGKALLFKYYGGVDAVPITLGVTDKEKIIDAVKAIAPSFSGINLEDIEFPKAYYILRELKESLRIPIWHDDEQGTAAVSTAGLLNAFRLLKKDIKNSKIVVFGVGAANSMTIMFLQKLGVNAENIIAIDSNGPLYKGREDMEEIKSKNPVKYEITNATNKEQEKTIEGAFKDADAVVAASKPGPGVIKGEWIRKMNEPIVFALANPYPEIGRKEALAAGAKVYCSGRSDLPNQINNSLVFPGMFRGALDSHSKAITDNMAIAAAKELAQYALKKGLKKDYIIPRMDDVEVHCRVAAAVAYSAVKEGIASRKSTYSRFYREAKEKILEAQRRMFI
ncbi:MAG: NADP-dependent malic enzyme [Candidatus Micrarchaeaceae archaeon]